MNVAPLLLSVTADFKLADPDYAASVSTALARVDSKALSFPTGLLVLSGWETLTSDRPMGVGLFSLTTREWKSAIGPRGVGPARTPEKLGGVLRATPISGERMLLFPDDASEDPNVAVYAPVVGGPHSFILHRLYLALPAGKGTTTPAIAPSGGCTEAIEGKIGSRRFSCSRTGCQQDCDEDLFVIGGTYTFSCRC